MDTKRIDAMIHAVAIATSRRGALGGALGAGMAALLARFEGNDAAARKRRKKKKRCTGGKTKCGKSCVNLATSGAHCGICGNACESNFECLNGFCDCGAQGDCPGCICALIVDGETVCVGALTTTTCVDNDDCPPRGGCRQTANGNFCGEPCPA